MTLNLKVADLRGLIKDGPKLEIPGKFSLELMGDSSLPAWRGLLAGSFNYGAVFGQPIRPLSEFGATYCKALKQHPFFNKYWARWFQDGQPGPELQYRIGTWYETGVSELYLYCCLHNIIEDHAQHGFVLYDPRLDSKYRADLFVLIGQKQIRLNSYWNDSRSVTMAALPGGNKQYLDTVEIRVPRSEERHELLNGFRLFAQEEIDAAVVAIYSIAGPDLLTGVPTIKDLLKNQKDQPF